jgi:serine/threonine-protein kinase
VAADRLAELAALAEPAGAGVRWPIHIAGEGRGRDHMRGWCNGSAGMVFLFTLAAKTLGEPRYLVLAERAGRDACAEPDDAGHICCGNVGQAYAALTLHRATRETRWLTFAERVAAGYAEPDGVPGVRFAYSLLKGPLGGQLLAAELETASDEARIPLFELAGWA